MWSVGQRVTNLDATRCPWVSPGGGGRPRGLIGGQEAGPCPGDGVQAAALPGRPRANMREERGVRGDSTLKQKGSRSYRCLGAVETAECIKHSGKGGKRGNRIEDTEIEESEQAMRSRLWADFFDF